MNLQEFVTIMGVLAEGVGKPFTDRQTEVWHDMLKDLSADALKYAVKRFLSEDGEFPSIAKLRRLAAEHEHGRLPSFDEAWRETRRVLSRYSQYLEPQEVRELLNSVHPVIRQAIETHRLYRLSNAENMSIELAQFRTIYESISKRLNTQQRLPVAMRERLEVRQQQIEPSVKLLAESMRTA